MSKVAESSVVPNYIEMPLGRFLNLLASGEPAPGGGSVAAIAVALAAGLSAMAARFSTEYLTEVDTVADRAENLLQKVEPLVRADAEAYGRVLAAYRLPRERKHRNERIQAALSEAADVPLSVSEAGAAAAELATYLAEEGNPNLRGDAIAAVLLAEAGVRAAAELVKINAPNESHWLQRAEEHAAVATKARQAVKELR